MKPDVPNDTAYFCPTCGSAALSMSSLAGGNAHCEICGWQGPQSELAGVPFSHDLGSPEGAFHAFMLDVRRLLSQEFATAFIKLLLKWGFLPTPPSSVQVARYIGAIAKGITTAIFEERKNIEKERVKAS